MLQSLLPKAHRKFRALPLLGSVADGFDDWLTASGYTPGSRKFSFRFLRHEPMRAAASERFARRYGSLIVPPVSKKGRSR